MSLTRRVCCGDGVDVHICMYLVDVNRCVYLWRCVKQCGELSRGLSSLREFHSMCLNKSTSKTFVCVCEIIYMNVQKHKYRYICIHICIDNSGINTDVG